MSRYTEEVAVIVRQALMAPAIQFTVEGPASSDDTSSTFSMKSSNNVLFSIKIIEVK